MVDKLQNFFFLFGGLFGYYTLSRLQAMRLYNFDMLFEKNGSPPSRVLCRYILGITSNMLVATCISFSWLWFNYLIPQTKIEFSFIQVIAGASIVISSSSIVLVSHRLVASLAIYFQKQLFSDDYFDKIDSDLNIKSRFLTQSKAHAHFNGAVIFLLLQCGFGYIMSFAFL
ncbi:hypothetical protein [Bdellovibrio sp. BCCA]|uniref:hypothetical protein n=1 Tax=Bdellovibrio sp. BCCA TaxID=3136281 RepID=UPI0030F0F795